jgi:hypothetical protein
MKTKTFVPSIKRYNTKKTIDYWGILFVGFIFVSSIGCFLFANNVDRQLSHNVSDVMKKPSSMMIDIDQKRKS